METGLHINNVDDLLQTANVTAGIATYRVGRLLIALLHLKVFVPFPPRT
jgi:hypothetical protein